MEGNSFVYYSAAIVVDFTCKTLCRDTIELWMNAWKTSNALKTGFPFRKQNGAQPGWPKPAHTAAAFGTDDIEMKFRFVRTVYHQEENLFCIELSPQLRIHRNYLSKLIVWPAMASSDIPWAAYCAQVGISWIKFWSVWTSRDIFKFVGLTVINRLFKMSSGQTSGKWCRRVVFTDWPKALPGEIRNPHAKWSWAKRRVRSFIAFMLRREEMKANCTPWGRYGLELKLLTIFSREDLLPAHLARSLAGNIQEQDERWVQVKFMFWPPSGMCACVDNIQPYKYSCDR